ncbi:hypothetical protein GCM10009755_24490 [Brevibacterium samyangense]|uniref:Uncharacterized protein n=1 Tax=Brevibacterium samyangense TaxID=366888 RepID=A0ABN2TL75_9MICO
MSCPAQPDGHPHLRGRGSGEELAERDEIRVLLLGHPTAPEDELLAEVPEVGDRTPEGRETEAGEDEEDLERGMHSTMMTELGDEVEDDT